MKVWAWDGMFLLNFVGVFFFFVGIMVSYGKGGIEEMVSGCVDVRKYGE